ncbi:MAG: hypothetical protein CVV47_07615 [Spirochaetae bacterium HGW-Spirochaetae-3]|jgi:PAS domain S-box-containing protein|nr:MAG: hypothetical protein CVV47_07615 [Spirochaetae bacterium HGW-Spirochaetae-3]
MSVQRRIRVLIALENGDDASLVAKTLEGSACDLYYAEDIQSAEHLMDRAEVILTDTEFAAGAFADWLSLWPLPAVLVVSPDSDPQRIAENMVDESSAFIVRDPDRAWIHYIPVLLRKTTSVRESLNRQNYNSIRTENSYMNLLRVVPDIVYVLDGDGCFVYLNEAISQLGWKPTELIGKHFAEIVHPDDLSEVCRSIVLLRYEGVKTGADSAPKLFDERRTGDRMTRGLDIRLQHRGMNEWTTANVDSWGEITSLGVDLPEFQGKGTGTIGLIHDISARRELERKMSRDLDARDVLLKEIHHRVKNNLQVVSSLLSLESDCVSDEQAKAVFVECQTQIQSMSLVHEQLYRGSSFDGVEASGYFARLSEYLVGIHDAEAKGIRIDIEAGDIVLPIDSAMPLAIITTELVSNSFKHGFPDSRGGCISITLTRKDGSLEFAVGDDGVGFAATRDAAQGKRKGIGMDLIEALAIQLGGTMTMRDSDGARTVITFPQRLKG